MHERASNGLLCSSTIAHLYPPVEFVTELRTLSEHKGTSRSLYARLIAAQVGGRLWNLDETAVALGGVGVIGPKA